MGAVLASQLKRDDVTNVAPPDAILRNRPQLGAEAHLGDYLHSLIYKKAGTTPEVQYGYMSCIMSPLHCI